MKVGDLVEYLDIYKKRVGSRGIVLAIFDHPVTKYPFARVLWDDGEVEQKRLYRLEVVS